MYSYRVDDTVVSILLSVGVKKSSKITRMLFSGRAMYLSCNGEDGTVPMATICMTQETDTERQFECRPQTPLMKHTAKE